MTRVLKQGFHSTVDDPAGGSLGGIWGEIRVIHKGNNRFLFNLFTINLQSLSDIRIPPYLPVAICNIELPLLSLPNLPVAIGDVKLPLLRLSH